MNGLGENDAALVNRLLQRDVSAFEDLYDRHSRIVYTLVLRILQQASTAEEVVQDVFLHLWRNAAQYDGSRGPFLPWLLTLARNRALDRLRLKSERQRRREEQTEELPPVVAIPDFEGSLDEKRRAKRVRGFFLLDMIGDKNLGVCLERNSTRSLQDTIAQAAKMLGIARQTLRQKLRELGLHVTHSIETEDED